MDLSEKEYYALLRTDLSAFIHRTFQTVCPGETFIPNWHIDTIAYHLQQCLSGDIKRLVITLPPRSLKSIITSVAFPAFVLGKDPSKQIVCTSYSQVLTDKHANDHLAIMQADWYQRCFPKTRLHPKKQSRSEFMTTQQGTRFSTSVGGTMTGRGGNIIIIDDPLKADEAPSENARMNCIDWYRNTLSSRLNNKSEDVMILIMQRLHEEDLAGYVLEHEGWTHLNIPAIAEERQVIRIADNQVHVRHENDVLHPERDPIDILNDLKSSLGSYAFAAQYQQRPVPIEGGIVKWAWFSCYENPPKKEENDHIVQSWDTASKAEQHNDYSVCTTWLIRKNQYYLLDVFRARLEYPALLRKIKCMAKRHAANRVIIEDKGAGTSLIQDLKENSDLNIIKFDPKDDKETRLFTATNVIEAGRVWLPKDAPWLDIFRHEMMLFPKGKHDDQVDSLSQFLQWTKTHPQLGDSGGVYIVYSRFNPHLDPLDWPLPPDIY